MSSINISSSLGANLGKSGGDTRMGIPKHIIATFGKNFTAAEIADSDALRAAIEDGIAQPRTSTDKLFIFSGFREAEDNTGDPQTGTLGDGYEEVLNEAIPKFNLRHTAGVAQTQSFVAFNGFTGQIFIVDHNGVFWYRDNGAGGAKGFSVANFYASYPRPGGTGAVVTGLIKLGLADAGEFKSGVGAIKLSYDISEHTTVLDVEFEETAQTSTVLTVKVKEKYAGVNKYTAFKTGLAQTGAWKVYKTNGTAVTVSGVATSDANETFALTLAAGTTGDVCFVEFQDYETLAELTTPVIGIEAIKYKFTRP